VLKIGEAANDTVGLEGQKDVKKRKRDVELGGGRLGSGEEGHDEIQGGSAGTCGRGGGGRVGAFKPEGSGAPFPFIISRTEGEKSKGKISE